MKSGNKPKAWRVDFNYRDESGMRVKGFRLCESKRAAKANIEENGHKNAEIYPLYRMEDGA